MTTATVEPATTHEYPCIDTGDGWFIVKDVPITSVIPAGGRPEVPDGIDAMWLHNAVNFGVNEWDRGHYCAPAHLAHNKLLSMSDPKFLGHAVPRRLGTYVFANGEKLPTIYADFKLNKKGYEMGRGGELPFISVEWDIHEKIIDSVAFLQSRPPHFRYRLFKLAEATKDEAARFEAKTRLAYLAKITDDKPAAEEHKPCAHCSEKSSTTKESGGTMPDAAKVDPTPIDQQDVKKAADAEAEATKQKAKLEADKSAAMEAAKYEGRIVALEQENTARKESDRVAALVTKAHAKCAGYLMTDKLKDGIAKFAKLGAEPLDAFLDAYLAGATKAPASSLNEFEQTAAIPDTEPAVAKFAKSPDETAAAKRLFAQWKGIKGKYGAQFMVSAEDHIRYNLASAVKAAQEGRA